MARIAGVDLPANKKIEFALTAIFGIGLKSAKDIVKKAEINPDTKAADLDSSQVNNIRVILDSDYVVEGDLRRDVSLNIKRLVDLGNYKGLRHRRGLPCRGQRTKTNARTRKGPRKTVAGKKKA